MESSAKIFLCLLVYFSLAFKLFSHGSRSIGSLVFSACSSKTGGLCNGSLYHFTLTISLRPPRSLTRD